MHGAVPLCFSVCVLALALLISGRAPALATKPPQIKERENREEWGLPPSGDLPQRQKEGKKGERQGGEKDSERLRHIILLSLLVRARLSMHGCGC